MPLDSISAVEYESMIYGRHLSAMPGGARHGSGMLDQSAYVLLSVIQANGPASIGELVQILQLDASTLNRQTAALLRHGLADRIPDPAGGIARRFSITSEGATVLRREREASRALFAELTLTWDQDDIARLGELLCRLNRDIENRFGQQWPRPTPETQPSGRKDA